MYVFLWVPGSYSNTGAVVCSQCAVGTITASIGAGGCLDCTPGLYQDQPGQTGCLSCLNGTYTDSYRTSSCKLCPAGYVSAINTNETGQAGSDTCTPCAAGNTIVLFFFLLFYTPLYSLWCFIIACFAHFRVCFSFVDNHIFQVLI